MSVSAIDERVQAPLVRAALYETLAMGFAYPSPDTLERLRQVAELATVEMARSAPALARLLEDVLGAVAGVDAAELAGEHSRLFSGQVVATPYETEYETDPFAKARQMADISGFYEAWGVELSEERRTMADFIGTQTEFMALLCRKEAYALQNGWEDKVTLSIEAESAFLGSHLGRWFEIFSSTVEAGAHRVNGALFVALARLLRGFVAVELTAFGLDPRRLTRRMVSDGKLPECDPHVVGELPEEPDDLEPPLEPAD